MRLRVKRLRRNPGCQWPACVWRSEKTPKKNGWDNPEKERTITEARKTKTGWRKVGLVRPTTRPRRKYVEKGKRGKL